MNSYLINRSQSVSFKDQESSSQDIQHGVPQGSVLGPLLFCIYIADMPIIFKFCKVFQYADDTTLLFEHNQPQSNLVSDIEKLESYCKVNNPVFQTLAIRERYASDARKPSDKNLKIFFLINFGNKFILGHMSKKFPLKSLLIFFLNTG